MKKNKLELNFLINIEHSNLDDFDEMQKILNKHGIKIEIDQDVSVLNMILDKYELSRHAGRMQKMTHQIQENGKTKVCRLSDIEKLQETLTDNEIVSKLNMSRATFYRRLKKAKENRIDGIDPLF